MCFVVYDYVGIFEECVCFHLCICVYIIHTDTHSYLDELIVALGMNLYHNTDQGLVIHECVCFGFDPGGCSVLLISTKLRPKVTGAWQVLRGCQRACLMNKWHHQHLSTVYVLGVWEFCFYWDPLVIPMFVISYSLIFKYTRDENKFSP